MAGFARREPARRPKMMREEGGGKGGQMERRGRRAQSGWGPFVGQHVGTAETQSGRVRAETLSADSPDS